MALQNETWYSTCMIGDLLMENKISTFLLQKPLKPKMPFTTLSVKSKKLRESFPRSRRKSPTLRICNRKPSKKLVTDALLRTWSPRLLQQRKELKMVRSFDLKSNLSTNFRNFSKILKTKHIFFYFKRSLWKLIFIKQSCFEYYYSGLCKFFWAPALNLSTYQMLPKSCGFAD